MKDVTSHDTKWHYVSEKQPKLRSREDSPSFLLQHTHVMSTYNYTPTSLPPWDLNGRLAEVVGKMRGGINYLRNDHLALTSPSLM